MEKIIIMLFAGTDAPCRLQHAVLFARDAIQRGTEARIVLEGQAPQWLLPFAAGEHKLRPLFEKARSEGLIDGVCKACAAANGALEAAEQLDLPLLSDAFGHVSLAKYVADGYQAVII